MNTKDKTILLYLISRVKLLNEEIKSLKEERELLIETAKNSIGRRQTLRIVYQDADKIFSGESK